MQTKLKERPILFSGEMVRAILDERKTQTRREVKLRCFGRSDTPGYDWHYRCRRGLWQDVRHDDLLAKCPYGSPGDRLWVRERWRCVYWSGEQNPDQREVIEYADRTRREIGREGDHTLNFENWCERIAWQGAEDLEKAGFEFDSFGMLREPDDYPHDDPPVRWRPSIHMPRWASRITLEITDVRVERLQDIRGRDAKAEGCGPDWDAFDEATFGMEGWEEPEDFIEECEQECDWVNYGRDLVYSREHAEWVRDRENYALRLAFRGLWESINGADSWDANPWVWVVEFKRLKESTDANLGD